MKKSLPQVDEVAKKSRKSQKFAKMAKSDGLNEVGDKNLIFQNDRLATATQKIKKMLKNPQIVFVKNTNTHKYPQKSAPGQGRRPLAEAKGLLNVLTGQGK